MPRKPTPDDFERALDAIDLSEETLSLVMVHGMPHILQVYHLLEEPVARCLFWAVSHWERRSGDPGSSPFVPGEKVTKVDPWAWMGLKSKTAFYLERGGSTLASCVVERPVPEPKTKREVRWRNGRWERLVRGAWK